MRFEIGKGGVATIALGVILLSTCVFVFGVAVGWDIGSQSERTASQMATAYPLTQPPSKAVPSPAAAPVAQPPANNSAPPAPPSELASERPRSTSPVGPSDGEAGRGAAPTTPRVTSASPTAPSELPAGGANGEEVAPPPQTATAERRTTPGGHRKPFNIQIEAAMDLNGANQMMRRLEELGYSSHLAPTNISGQTWYKVEVGPYTTQEEAAAAEAQLREKYNAAYGGGAGSARAAEPESE